jgi:hypothetical protein
MPYVGIQERKSADDGQAEEKRTDGTDEHAAAASRVIHEPVLQFRLT